MAPVVPTSPPTEFHSGTTVAFTASLAEFPSTESWDVTWELAGPTQVTVLAIPESDGSYTVVLAASENTLPAGTYAWTLSAAKTTGGITERYTAGTGYVAVLADPAAATENDQQLTDEKELALLNTTIAARLSGDVSRYSTADRSLEKIPLPELLAMRARLREKISRRKRGGTLKRIQHVFRDGHDG